MKDNKLDKFFREKSEENLPEFDPKFWEQAERMLDNALPEEEDRKRGAWWWWLPLLLIGGCGVCWFGPFEKGDILTEINNQEIIKEEKSNIQNENLNQVSFENKTNNLDANGKNDNATIDENNGQIVNSLKNNSNSAKNEIADLANKNSQNNGIVKEKPFTNIQANRYAETRSNVPTNTPEIVNPEISKAPVLTPKMPIDTPEEDLKILSLLPSLDAGFLEIPMMDLEDSLNIDSTQLQELLKPKKLRLGWSAEAVVRRELLSDSTNTTLASFQTGLTLDYKLSKRWDVHFDLLGRRESEELITRTNFEDQETGKAYGFGVTEITSLYRFKTQYFLESAALFRYKLNERHAIGVGVGAKYLLSVRADIIQRNKEAEFNFDDYEVQFVNRDEVIDSGWWEKKYTKDLLPFVQLRYDYRTTSNATLFFKMNAAYDAGWYRGPLTSYQSQFLLETSFGFNYQF